jgi:hypothetical protein
MTGGLSQREAEGFALQRIWVLGKDKGTQNTLGMFMDI